jgi:response regulator RpfG family c-di-GMP phosphodiesterase
MDTEFQLTEEQLEQARVVVVDDDRLVTDSLRSFLALEVEIEPIAFNESPRAAAYVREHEIDLIISDFLMPEMNGIELLTEVRRLRPEVPRVLLTGYADKENAIRAVNEARVYQYLEKPWNNEELRCIVIAGLERIILGRAVGKVAELADVSAALSRR